MKQKEQCYPKLSACWPGDDRLFAHFPPAERVKPKYRPACPAVMRGQQQECKTDKGDGLTARFCCSFDENKKKSVRTRRQDNDLDDDDGEKKKEFRKPQTKFPSLYLGARSKRHWPARGRASIREHLDSMTFILVSAQ
jgi:hypothetical protein